MKSSLTLCIFSQFNIAVYLQMSTSSSSSSLPSLDVSVHSGGTSTSGRTPDRTSSNSQQQQSTQSPYITPDFYIIRVSIESSAHEIEGKYVSLLTVISLEKI